MTAAGIPLLLPCAEARCHQLTSSLETVMTCPGGPGGPGGPGSPTPSWPRSPWKTQGISPGPPVAGPCPQPGGTYLLTGAAFVTFGSLERGVGRSQHYMETDWLTSADPLPPLAQKNPSGNPTSASSSRQQARLQWFWVEVVASGAARWQGQDPKECGHHWHAVSWVPQQGGGVLAAGGWSCCNQRYPACSGGVFWS